MTHPLPVTYHRVEAKLLRDMFQDEVGTLSPLDAQPSPSASYAGVYDTMLEFLDLITDRLGLDDLRVVEMRNVVGRMHDVCRAIQQGKDVPELHQQTRYADAMSPLVEYDRDVQVVGREMHDKMAAVIAEVRKTVSENNDTLLNSICALSLDSEWVFCHVVGGMQFTTCITIDKKYMSREGANTTAATGSERVPYLA